MLSKRVAILQQAGIVLSQAEIAACENKIMLVFVILPQARATHKTSLSHICVAINALVNTRRS